MTLQSIEHYAGIMRLFFSPVRIAHTQFPRDSISRTQRARLEYYIVALASGTRFITVSSDGEDVEHSGEDASKSSSRTSAEPESILPRLKVADHSSLCRKRSIAVNQSKKI